MKISIEADINAPLDKVWYTWITPEEIRHWNFASSDWHCPYAESDFVEGGQFVSRMEEKNGDMGFDFTGRFTQIREKELIEYTIGDGRLVSVYFSEKDGVSQVKEIFEAESEHSAELQRYGWLAILENFKAHVEQESK